MKLQRVYYFLVFQLEPLFVTGQFAIGYKAMANKFKNLEISYWFMR